jgi:hypothetical protein
MPSLSEVSPSNRLVWTLSTLSRVAAPRRGHSWLVILRISAHALSSYTERKEPFQICRRSAYQNGLPTTYEVFLSLLVYFDRMTERVNAEPILSLHQANQQSLERANADTNAITVPGISYEL